jgi:hypothetical protein
MPVHSTSKERAAMNLRSRTAVVATIVAASTLSATTATAVVTQLGGGSMLERHVRTQTASTLIDQTTFRTIGSAGQTITVPSSSGNRPRLVVARFTSENRCTGQEPNSCMVNVVARSNPTGATVDMHPQSGTDFAFSAATPEVRFQSNSVARVFMLTPGSWSILVQGAVTKSGVTARFDDWTFEVDINA